MMYEEIKDHGITADTPKNIVLGAGTIHMGLEYKTNKWNFAESLIGATSGGTKVTITPEYKDIEADGALVKTEGLTIKQGETAVMETNFLELTPEIMKACLVGTEGVASDISGYTEIKSKAHIEQGDYVTNLGFVGKTADGRPIIIIFPKALCTSGFELESKNKENSVFKATFECVGDIAGDLQTLPYRILYPTPVVG